MPSSRPEVTKKTATLYEHCVRALDLAVKRTSAERPAADPRRRLERRHEPRRRGGQGRERLARLVPAEDARRICRRSRKAHGDAKRAKAWDKHADRLKQALENAGLGRRMVPARQLRRRHAARLARSDECKIDSIAQSWSVLSGEGDPARSRTAMEAATQVLVDDELKIIKLFTPPFSQHAEGARLHQELSAGRARKWRAVHACGDLVRHRAGRNGPRRRGLALLLDAQSGQPCARREGGRALPRRALCRGGRHLSAADKGGRGGWTWYTGSAGWLYRAAVESILGIRKERATG